MDYNDNNAPTIVTGKSHILVTKEDTPRQAQGTVAILHFACREHSKKHKVKEKGHCSSLSQFFFMMPLLARLSNLIMMLLLFTRS